MKKYFHIKKLYQFILFSTLLLTSLKQFSLATFAATDEPFNYCADIKSPGSSDAGKYTAVIPVVGSGVPETRAFDTKDLCLTFQKDTLCDIAIKQEASCDPRQAVLTITAGALPVHISANICLGKNITLNASNIDDKNSKPPWQQRFSNLLGSDYDDNWDTTKNRMYGVWSCQPGTSIAQPATLAPPRTAPAPTRCDFRSYDVFATSIGSTTCGGSAKCEVDNVIRDGSGTRADKKFYCINDRIVMCPNTVTTYATAKTSSECVDFNNITATSTYGTFGSTSRKATLAADISPIGLIKTISNFLFYFAILYFVLLILSNGFAYVRAAEDPGKLKEIKASLFNTIAGFLFVLLSGGLIISLINQIGI